MLQSDDDICNLDAGIVDVILDLDGSTAAITFVVLGGETPVLTWSIPLDEPVTRVSPLWVEGSEGVELPAPSVGVPTKKRKDGTSD